MQKAGAQMWYEVSPPLINHDEKNVLASRHRRTSKEPNEARLELRCCNPMNVICQLGDDNPGNRTALDLRCLLMESRLKWHPCKAMDGLAK
jgi:hypothetical protein